jgi:hypothetical protein
MTETETQANVLDQIPEQAAPIVVAAAAGSGSVEVSSNDLLEDGLIMPIADPQVIRAAFARKQRAMAAILDDADYLYVVIVPERGKTEQRYFSSRTDAEKVVVSLNLPADYLKATPKKSGIAKLALALGIEARRVEVRGLPIDDKAGFSSVTYEARHRKSGKTEQGVGWCDATEKSGRISRHEIITTADTRAYNRAVMRLAGFGDVTGEELVPMGEGERDVHFVDSYGTGNAEPRQLRQRKPIPLLTDDRVLMAARSWAESFAHQQATGIGIAKPLSNSQSVQACRARARRGDQQAGIDLGMNGQPWHGTAQDGPDIEPFEVEPSPVSVEDILRARAGTEQNAIESVAPSEQRPAPAPQAPPPERAAPPMAAPSMGAPAMGSAGMPTSIQSGLSGPISNAQRQKLSKLLLDKLGSKEAARDWLMRTHSVQSTGDIKAQDYEAVVAALNKAEA